MGPPGFAPGSPTPHAGRLTRLPHGPTYSSILKGIKTLLGTFNAFPGTREGAMPEADIEEDASPDVAFEDDETYEPENMLGGSDMVKDAQADAEFLEERAEF